MTENMNLPGIEKLEGSSNYNNWKFCMEMHLIQEDLWECIETDAEGNVKNKDEKKEHKARAKICLSVKSSAYIHIRNAKTAKETWDNLKRAYEDKGLTRRLGLLRILFSQKLSDFKNMETYVTQVLGISQQLADIGAVIEDEFVAVILLSGLPIEFNPMVMALESSNVKITSDLVKSKLLQEHLKWECANNEKDMALFSKGMKFEKKKGFKCYKCHRQGHFAKNCPDRGKTVQYQNIGQSSQTASKHSNKKFSLLTTLPENIGLNEWYVDSGATAHMTGKKDWIVNYTVDTIKEVTIANNEKLSTDGRGDVQIDLADNSCVKTITDVVYVPKLSTNLLSVSKMVEKGLSVIFSNRGCQIYGTNCKVEGEVIASACETNGIYKLNVQSPLETLQQEQTYFTISMNSQELWHRRLGHLNKQSMNLLRKGMVSGVKYTDMNSSPCFVY